jgi:hypothetical protein
MEHLIGTGVASGLSVAMHRHHVFPHAFRNKFTEIFGDPKYIDRFLVRVPEYFHRRVIHSGTGGGWYNHQWGKFFKEHPKPSPRETVRFMRDLMKHVGFEKFQYVD